MAKRWCRYFSWLVLVTGTLLAGYKAKEIPLKPALEYPAHQDFQSIAIGAYPCNSLARTQEIFDTDKLIEKRILPVLVVIENKNDFPVQLTDTSIYLLDKTGQRNPTIPYVDVLLRINSKKPLSMLSGPKDLLATKLVKKEMLQDFEQKALGERTIQPSSSEHGVVFFEMPAGGDLTGYSLYFPEIINVTSGEPLIFFEFELQ